MAKLIEGAAGRRVRWEEEWPRTRHTYLPTRPDGSTGEVVINGRRSVYRKLVDSLRETYYRDRSYLADAGERMGVLVGSVGRGHREGEWVITVAGFEEVPFLSSSGIHASMETRLVREAGRRAREAHCTEGVVGWYHTHPSMALFLSPTDLRTYSGFYPEPWQVALVVDPESWQAAYFWRDANGKVEASPAPWRQFDLIEASRSPGRPSPADDSGSAERVLPAIETAQTNISVPPPAQDTAVEERVSLGTRLKFYSKLPVVWQLAAFVLGVLVIALLWRGPSRSGPWLPDALLAQGWRSVLVLRLPKPTGDIAPDDGPLTRLTRLQLAKAVALPGTTIRSDEGPGHWLSLAAPPGQMAVLGREPADGSTAPRRFEVEPAETLVANTDDGKVRCSRFAVVTTASTKTIEEVGRQTVVPAPWGDIKLVESDCALPGGVAVPATGSSAEVTLGYRQGVLSARTDLTAEGRPPWCTEDGRMRAASPVDGVALYVIDSSRRPPLTGSVLDSGKRLSVLDGEGGEACARSGPGRYTVRYAFSSDSPAFRAVLAGDRKVVFVRQRPDDKFEVLSTLTGRALAASVQAGGESRR